MDELGEAAGPDYFTGHEDAPAAQDFVEEAERHTPSIASQPRAPHQEEELLPDIGLGPRLPSARELHLGKELATAKKSLVKARLAAEKEQEKKKVEAQQRTSGLRVGSHGSPAPLMFDEEAGKIAALRSIAGAPPTLQDPSRKSKIQQNMMSLGTAAKAKPSVYTRWTGRSAGSLRKIGCAGSNPGAYSGRCSVEPTCCCDQGTIYGPHGPSESATSLAEGRGSTSTS